MNERLPQSVQCRPSETYFSPSSQVCDCMRNTSHSYRRAISKTSRKNMHWSIFVLHTRSSARKATSDRTPFLNAGKVGLSLGHPCQSRRRLSIGEPPRDPWDKQPLGHSSNAAWSHGWTRVQLLTLGKMTQRNRQHCQVGVASVSIASRWKRTVLH